MTIETRATGTTNNNLTQCWSCHCFGHEHADYDTGQPESFWCGAADFGDDTEHVPEDYAERVSIMFQNILFQLSSLNNCPEYLPKPKIEHLLERTIHNDNHR